MIKETLIHVIAVMIILKSGANFRASKIVYEYIHKNDQNMLLTVVLIIIKTIIYFEIPSLLFLRLIKQYYK